MVSFRHQVAGSHSNSLSARGISLASYLERNERPGLGCMSHDWARIIANASAGFKFRTPFQLSVSQEFNTCLLQINGLKKVKLIDAAWIWTEPHSRRLKLKLTVQKEVGNGAVLQQAMIVTFVVRNQQCNTCAAAFTDNTWTAVVQVRQRVDHKRTFFYLEQLILKHSAHTQCISIQVRD